MNVGFLNTERMKDFREQDKYSNCVTWVNQYFNTVDDSDFA